MDSEKIITNYETYAITKQGLIHDLRTGRYHEGHYHFGYRHINLTNPNGIINKAIHRLVAEAFIPNLENKSEVDHINRKKDDNRVENLRWVTDLEQVNNRGDFKNNKLGMKYIHKDKNRYKVQITRNYQKIYNKRFDTLEEAIEARNLIIKD